MTEKRLQILIADYADLKDKPSLLKIAIIKEIERKKGQLYNKWLGTFMEPGLRDDIRYLRSLIE